mmetsp:Transcript_15083/g.23332  ORF Transcript_15083/g.23332 Transcript_15083/m.23332 type:complete len:85 (-) Transcript_15083:26-280(-)
MSRLEIVLKRTGRLVQENTQLKNSLRLERTKVEMLESKVLHLLECLDQPSLHQKHEATSESEQQAAAKGLKRASLYVPEQPLEK